MSGIPTHGSPSIAQPSVDRFAVLAFADSRERVFELAQAPDHQRSTQGPSPGASSVEYPQMGLRCMGGNRIAIGHSGNIVRNNPWGFLFAD